LSLSINGQNTGSLHFVGILGSGMSAIAYYCLCENICVTGSDRLAGSADINATRKRLEDAGCVIFPQDGSAIARNPDAVVVSTAIEETNPDIAEARAMHIPVVHRSDVLTALTATKRTVAIAGTSGKSTVSAMVFEILSMCGKNPSLITGAGLTRLEEQGLIGNAFHGTSDILVIEADESDGSLVKYSPEVSVFLNISKDHKPVEEVKRLFGILAAQSKCVVVNSDDPELHDIKYSTTFGESPEAKYRPDSVESIVPSVVFYRSKIRYELPLPGKHNLSNALAALCVCNYLGCDDTACAGALQQYKGVRRRFSMIRLQNGLTVIDDFAHNPEKVKAAIKTAKLLCKRLFAIFQPHGFGPTRFLKDDFVRAFSEMLGKEDKLYLLPIYYAGGTATKDISSDEIAVLVKSNSRSVFAPSTRRECMEMIKAEAVSGDAVLLMGARDPSLPEFARQLADALRSL
jgi:UDP-N-acetylmuramate--alanine ligase